MRWLFKQLELAFPRNVVAGSLWDARFAQRNGYRRNHALEAHARELLRALGAHKLARKMRVEWNPRMRTCAGRADYREKLISLNPVLLNLDDSFTKTQSKAANPECEMHSSLAMTVDDLECSKHSSLSTTETVLKGTGRRESVVWDEIDRTLRHELAHLLAQWRVGRRRIAPHGAEWRQACRDLGIADEARCHNLPFASKTYAPQYVYVCPKCKEKFPRVRRIRRAIACLACCRAHNRGEFDSRFKLKLEGHAPSCP
jgi:predicted SprT family Zn-dependent metalloprotease